MLTPLATPADAESYGYGLPADTAADLLARASAKVRAVAGFPITQATSTVRLRADSGRVTLPGGPVTAVASVAEVADDNTTTAATGWRWTGGDTIRGVWGLVDVTYTHGYTAVPDALVELVCQIAARLGTVPAAATGGITSRSVGSVSWTADPDAITPGLTTAEAAAVARILGTVPAAQMVRVRQRWGRHG